MLTIQSRLSADENARFYLWNICLQHGLLINKLIEEIPKQEKFHEWQQKGEIPRKSLEAMCKIAESEFKELPKRLITSAILTGCYMYKSWFALQKKQIKKVNGKKYYLKLQMRDLELSATTDFSEELICSRAQEILATLLVQDQQGINDNCHNQISILFQFYEETEDVLTQRAIAYLLRNNLRMRNGPENPEYVLLNLQEKKIKIDRLEKQLQSRFPRGRDLTGEMVLNSVDEAVRLPTSSNSLQLLIFVQSLAEARVVRNPALRFNAYLLQLLQEPRFSQETYIAEHEVWHDGEPERLAKLATLPKSLPYPILFESNDDLYWSLEPRGSSKEQSVESVSEQSDRPSTASPKRKRKKRRRINRQESICVRFKGLAAHKCIIQCSHRHLPIIRQCLDEWQLHKSLPDDDKFSLGLFPLRSARLIWGKDKQELHKKPSKGSQNPSSEANDRSEKTESEEWRQYRLFLHLTIDTRALTAEGTEQLRQEKLEEVQKKLKGLEQNAEAKNHGNESTELAEQQQLVKEKNRALSADRTQSTLNRLQNPTPPRPSRTSYVGDPSIVVGVCFSRRHRASIVVMNIHEQRVLQYIGVRALLSDHSAKEHHLHFSSNPKRKGKRRIVQMKYEQYHLVDRFWRQQQQNMQRRSQEQKQGLYAEDDSESQLGQYLDRLLAARIVEAAIRWKASSIVIPELRGIRESIECEIQAWAQRKFPEMQALQKRYAKEFRASFHRWSYGRLAQSIRNRASRDNLAIELGHQPRQGTLQEKAVAVVQSAYAERQA